MPATRYRILFFAALMGGTSAAPGVSRGADLIQRSELGTLGLQRYWQAEVPIGSDLVRRCVLLDDSIYALTEDNRVFAVHTGTGIIRWSAEVAPPGKTIHGPTHSKRFAVFSTPTAIHLLSRRTGRVAGEPRALRGVITEINGDAAEVNIGSLHGVALNAMLGVRTRETINDPHPLARLRIDSVHERDASGRFVELDPGHRPKAGDVVSADVEQPIPQVSVPFSPSSPAVSDDASVYFGAANQRFYCLSIIGGYRNWETQTVGTVVATPVMVDDTLYVASQGGQVTAVSTKDRAQHWTYKTEGSVFVEPVVARKAVYVASSDRSLHAIDRETGRKLWRARFDSELLSPPVVSHDVVFQYAPQGGLHALDPLNGEPMWHFDRGCAFLTRMEDAVLVLCGTGGEPGVPQVLTGVAKLDAKTGQVLAEISIQGMDYVLATATPSAVFFVDRLGHMLCARSASEIHLTPDEVAEAMRNDAAMEDARDIRKRMDAERLQRQRVTSQPAAPVDWLRSHSTVPPAVGPSLVPPTRPRPTSAATPSTPTKPAAKPASGKKPPAASPPAKKKAKEEGADEGEGDEGASDKPESSDDGG